jgi:protease-4
MSSENTESSLTDSNHTGSKATTAEASGHQQNAGSNWERQVLSDLVTGNLKEQRAARRWKVGLRLGWLCFWVVVMWQVLAHNQTSTTISTPHTALVNIKGEIADGGDASAENVVASMRAALELSLIHI